MADTAKMRRMMVDGQVRTADVTDARILSAMIDIPRERFVPQAKAALAYLDLAIPVGEHENAPGARKLLTPMVLAKLVQALQLEEGARVLDVGCATGYSAALLARICSAGTVVALEEDAALARQSRDALAEYGVTNAEPVRGKLAEGSEKGAPYDAILVEGAVELLPAALTRQLADGGRLACILGAGPAAKAMLYLSDMGQISGRPIFDAAAPVLPGFAKPAAFVF